ncbi:glycosyltransferase [Microbacterium sp. PRC9]|uniref:glycosyltransferase n=1 Tax=Microbacterium sp. PRC9 TaxID=2962591 RepID=UPI002881C3FC|nr:glycosyltransferase [Microbacterium sp. PRC9]MDT0141091.1 glycosyltransferase [Microbacterium sp. PRC9]
MQGLAGHRFPSSAHVPPTLPPGLSPTVAYTRGMLSRARALWRASRTLPLIGAALAGIDRLWWANTIRRADIVDLEFVAGQGHAMSSRAAIRRYVRGGFRSGFALNPLFMERTVSRQLSDADRVPALYAYLVNDRSELDTSPNWDAPGLASAVPESLEDPAGPLGFAWRRARRNGWIDLGPSEAPVRVGWRDVIHATTSRTPASTGAVPSGSSTRFVCVLGPEEQDPDRALTLAAIAATELGANVDLILTGESFEEMAQAALLAMRLTAVTVRRGDPVASSVPPGAPSHLTTVFRGPGAELTGDGLRHLAREGSVRPAAALWLAPDGVIASAGTVFVKGRRTALLNGHPAEDAYRVGSLIDVPELAGPARAWPAGSSPTAAGRTLTKTVVMAANAHVPPNDAAATPDTDVDAILAPAGLAVADRTTDGGVRYRRVAPAGAHGRLRRRWAIKTASPAGTAGESWGDTHFARGIADALRRLGEEVVIDAYDARNRPTTNLDDVTLTLRGPKRIESPPTGRSVLWIISHPDEITREEVHGFDVVFAASTSWAAKAGELFDRRIEPLLQCTDVTRFHPSGAARTDEIVFVGTARGIARPVVVEPLAAGVPVRVYGPDWRGYIPATAIAATGIPNHLLPRLYERAAVVLNDHWPAMRREGFVSNRLYDVVASGGRAISDDVDGIDEIFGAAVQTFRTTRELVALFQDDLDTLFPDEAELTEAGAIIRERDSFDARARSLVAAADSLEAQGGRSGSVTVRQVD